MGRHCLTSEPSKKRSNVNVKNSSLSFARTLGVLPSELVSESGDELSLFESNNQSKIPVVKSESLDEVLSSSPNTNESKDSLAVPLNLTGAALARRLNVSPSTLRHKKNARNFGQWTKGHDPDGIAWHFDGQQFVSVLPDIEVKPFE